MTFFSNDDVLGAGNKLGLVANAIEGGSVLFIDSPYSLLTVNFSEDILEPNKRQGFSLYYAVSEVFLIAYWFYINFLEILTVVLFTCRQS
jgi:hypothetical protein